MGFQVGFDLVTDSSGFIVGVAEASRTLDTLTAETKSFENDSKAAFSKATSEVDKFTQEIDNGIKQTGKMSQEVNKMGNTANAIKQLKQEIKFYTSEAYKAGAGTKAFADNLAKAGRLKDELQDINKAVQALNGNLGENLARAAGSSIGVVSKGFEGIIALEVLAGEKSKDFEQTLLKLQSLNAIASVAQELGGLGDRLTEIKLGITGIFSLIKANPLGAFLTVVTAVGAGFAFLADKLNLFGDTEEERYAKLLQDSDLYIAKLKAQIDLEIALAEAAGKNTDAVENKKTAILKKAIGERIDALYKLEAIQGELNDDQLKQLKDFEGQYESILDESLVRQEKLKREKAQQDKDLAFKILEAQAATIKDSQARELEQLRIKGVKEADSIKQQLALIYTDAAERESNQNALLNALSGQYQAEKAAIIKKYADQRKQNEKELADFIIGLGKRVQQAELENLSPIEKLERQKDFDLQELGELRKQLIEKGKLTDKNFTVSAEQEQQFAALKTAIRQKASAEILKLEIDEQNKLMQVKVDAAEKTLENLSLAEQNAVSSIGLTAKPKDVSDVDFETIKQQKVAEVQKQYAEQRLLLQQQEIAQRRDAQIAGLNNELVVLEASNEENKDVRKQQIIDEISLIEEGFALENDKIQTNAANQINDLTQKIEDAKRKLSEAKPITLAGILGITQQELNGVFTVGNAVNGLADEIIASQQRMIDAQIKANQEAIDAREENISDLESQLDKELQLNEEGRANNSDGIRKQLEEEERLRQEDLARQAQAFEEKNKIAKLGVAADGIAQASNMITAATQIYAGLTKIDPTGISATIAVAAMFTAFAIQKANAIAQIDAQEAPGFKEGVIDLQGPGTSTSDSINAKLSRGESVMTAKETADNYDLFKGIREKDSVLVSRGIDTLLKNTGISLIPDFAAGLKSKKNAISEQERVIVMQNNEIDYSGRFDQLIKQNGEKVYIDHRGNLVKEKGSHKLIIRKGNV